MVFHSLLISKYLKILCGFYDTEFKLPKPFSYLWQRKRLRQTKKTITHINITNNFENSDEFVIPDVIDLCYLSIHILYFLCVLGFLLIQPITLIIKCIQDGDNIRQHIGFISLFFLPPINYVWLKYYLTTNHLNIIISEYDSKYINKTNIFLLSSTLGVFYVIFIITYYLKKKETFYIDKNIYNFWIYFTINELLTKTMIIHNNLITLFVFYKHNSDISNFIYEIERKTNFILDTNNLLNLLIKDSSILKLNIERSIHYFNDLISISTILVCVSIFIFFDVKFIQTSDIINPIEAIVYSSFYLIFQLLFFLVLYDYACKRQKLYESISNYFFVHKYLFVKSLHMQKDINKMHVIINWNTLKDILKNDWVDFNIMGISSKDGDLIKKAIAIGSLLLIISSV